MKRIIQLPVANRFDKLLVEIQHFSQSTEFADHACLVGLEPKPPPLKNGCLTA